MVIQRQVDNGGGEAGRLLTHPDTDLLEPRYTQKCFKVDSSSLVGNLSYPSSCDNSSIRCWETKMNRNGFLLGIFSLDGVIAEKSHNYNYVINVDTVI